MNFFLVLFILSVAVAKGKENIQHNLYMNYQKYTYELLFKISSILLYKHYGNTI